MTHRGHVVMTQGSCDDTQGSCDDTQGSCDDTQGSCDDTGLVHVLAIEVCPLSDQSYRPHPHLAYDR